MKQVFAIAFTDSIHSIRYSDATRDIAKFFEQVFFFKYFINFCNHLSINHSVLVCANLLYHI